MRQRYNSTWWSVDLTDVWEAEQDEYCATFISKRGVGALQISAYHRGDEIVTDEELLDFAEDELTKDANPNSVIFGEFVGLETSYFAGESFWRKLWLRKGSLILFVTYNCTTEERAFETEDVNQILKSLSLKSTNGTTN